VICSLLALSAWGAGEWIATGEAHGCVVESREATATSKSAMRGTCTWPEVRPEKLVAMLGQFDRYEEFISPIADARIERIDENRALVYQRHEYFGIADREMLLWMTAVPREGGTSFEWTTASEQPLALDSGSVRTIRNEGRWTVSTLPSGGARVVHEISLDPGGSIPGWVVRLARSRGFARILGEVRQHGAS
jgi:hypothetical protein